MMTFNLQHNSSCWEASGFATGLILVQKTDLVSLAGIGALVQFLFFFVLYSLSDITMYKNKGK